MEIVLQWRLKIFDDELNFSYNSSNSPALTPRGYLLPGTDCKKAEVLTPGLPSLNLLSFIFHVAFWLCLDVHNKLSQKFVPLEMSTSITFRLKYSYNT